MELPSMVQRSGDTLIVRSVVSGNQLYADQQHNSIGPEVLNNMNTSTATTNNNNNNNGSSAANGGVGGGLQVNPSISSSLIMEQIERLKRSQEAAQQIMQQQLQQQQQQQQQAQQNAAMELKEEGLPQCKIKRNYSCSYCTYFTQNPRYHLTHLRDVHGEKIVINKCKLCLYASRHYQKLVRHMKMVHGCTEGVTSGHGQARGKRGMNRDRKRKLEDSMAQAGSAGAIKLMNLEAFNAEQLKADMEQKLNRDLDLFTQQQQQLQHEEQQKSQQQQLSITAANAFFAAAAYEHQLRAQRDLAEKDALRKNDHSNYERRESTSPPAPNEVTSDENYNNASHAQQKSYDYNPSSSTSALNSNATAGNQQESKIQMPPQRLSYELTPSPSGSNSSPPPAGQSTSGSTTPLSVMLPTDEPSNNRLLKCSLCDFTTLYRNNLLEHEIEDHCDAKFYRCEKCSYVTHIKARFSKHVKYHSMPMIKCVTCDFRTPYKWNLDRHMKNHGGAGPFRCAACDFTADIKQSLTVHEMNHHVPPVGHAAGMTLARRRNKVGGTDLSEDFFSDSAEMLEDHFNNNNMDDYDEMLMTAGPVEGVYESKRLRYEEDEPTDLSQKGGSSDTSSVHNQAVSTKAKKPLPNLIPISKEAENILNLSSDMVAGGRYFNEKQTGGDTGATAAASQLSPTTTIASSSAASGKSLLARKSGSFFDKIKFSTTTNENLICPCGHMAKCLSESIIHRKSCTFGHDDIDLDDEDHDEDGEEGRLEIDFNEDDECDKQSQSALNLSVTGSTRCQHCRHRCKSSADLLNHLKICSEANSRCGDSLSGESSIGGGVSGRLMMGDGDHQQQSHHPMENRVFVWNKIPRNQGSEGSQSFDGSRGMHPNAHGNNGGGSGSMGPGGILSANNDENSYYGVETAPGYGEVTKKMTPEEEAANSSLKKVYKCPHCSFWASTASRFHVHIVGHLNKKPFECSLCSYRSNWRWDITKHIRLKTIRDPSHKNARVLMNDETGRRNYTKYNKYITLMKVTEEDGDPKLMKSGEMTPNQVASLAFINDYNQKQQQQQQQGSVASSGSTSLSNILNGVREDITLEPIPSKNSLGMVGDDNMADNFIRLPLLASMMNAAMAQQQHQKGQQVNTDHENATLITPSVTISAVKKNPQTSASSFKPSDEIILEVRPDSSEKNYKCRKCNFRHMNRDAVLAHVKVHFPDPNAPIVTATATTSPNKSSQLQATGPLQITANSNLYMNKVLAAMCLTQQPNSSANAQAQLSNLVAAGLLDQSGNSALSGLALALAGKSPLKASQLNAAAAAANIIEHGEQKAILNDQASAENTMTSPNQLTLVKALQHNSQQQQQQLQATSSLSSTSNCGYGPATAKSPSSSSSLQNLLTSPRGGRQSSNTASLDGGLNDTTMVMGSSKTTTTTATTNTTATTLTNKPGTMAITATANPPPPPSPQAIVTTTSTPISSPCTFNLTQAAMPTTPPPPPPPPFGSSASTLNSKHFGDGHHFTESDLLTAATASGCGVGGLLASNGVVGLQDLMMVVMGASSHHHLPNVGIKSSLSLSSNPNPIQTNQNQNSSTSNSSSATSIQNHTSSSSPSNSNNTNNASNNNLGHVCSGNGSNNTHNNNNNNNSGNGGNGNNNNNNNLLTHETATGDRRDPSPYRCGHCHQVSNWKHVIQRHCRLKHAGAINIETLDRAATGDRHMAPVYKPLVNGASISDQLQQQQQHQSSNNNLSTNGQYSLTLKALQQQNNNSNNNTNTNHNNNSVLIDNNTTKLGMANLPKSETPQSLLSSSLPLTGNSADLQAATVAYLAAAYKAAHSQNGINNATLANITNMAEELLLQQQLQKNDQIEITRVSSSSNGQQQHHLGLLNGQSSNLAQLLESNNNNAMSAPTPTNTGNNNKSKQQKCPLCTYICDSKSQMNYHISLHKPTQYECHLCTFVCAKKQHLSSHMRSVHQMLPQQQQQQLQQQQAFAAASSAALNMDFSLALKVAAAKNQQDSPLAIDLSGMKHNIAALNSPAQRSSVGGTNTAAKATSAASTQHLPPEYQYRLIYYCNRCPARYAQKHNDPLTAKNDLDEHLRQHEPFPNNPDDPRKCLCDYCDYRAAHENLIQAHRHVHTSQYQEKCNELYKNCKDDTVYRAPKLMHITATRKQHQHETIWVVDQDLNEGHIMKMGGQNSSITSSSANAGFEGGNSLLKKQLESKQSSPQNVNEMTHKDDKEESNAPASMSPDISETENSLEKPSGRESNSPSHVSDNVEKCQHCPFESSLRSEFKTHIQQHICVSQQPLAYTCEHCDYTAEEQDHIDEHTRIHFNSMEKLKDVAFFTSYDKLELSMEQPLNEEEQDEDAEREENNHNEKAKGSENNLELNIKKEITANNNNDEDRVNENLKQASNPNNNNATATTTNNNEATTSTNPDENKSQKCAKIILYKNDGCLSIKKENNSNNNETEQQDQQQQQNSSSSSNSQNISERLRRRISRPSGMPTSSANNNNNNSTSDDQQQQSTTTTSHKTILVNAKTGQVISRN